MNFDNSKIKFLNAMEIPVWVRRTQTASSSTLSEAEVSWDALQNTVKSCKNCVLCHTRTNAVFGMGNPASRFMLIGEGPGANEDRQGLPFVGKAGQLLDTMLHSIDINREKAYIANIVKCRPPNNRDPSAEEIAACTPYLQQQIAYIQPRLIVALGRIAAHYLLQTQASMAQLRGKLHRYQAIPLIVTYHPAYLLRNPADKAQAWRDLMMVSNFLKNEV